MEEKKLTNDTEKNDGMTDEEIVKDLEEYIRKGYTSTPAEVWLALIRRLQYGYSSASKASEEWKAKYEAERKENETIKAELKNELAEHEEFTKKAKEEIDFLTKIIGMSKRKTKNLELQKKIAQLTCTCNLLRDGTRLYERRCDEYKEENERLTEENLALSKGVKRLKKRYEETTKRNADEVVKKFCETTMYAEQERLVKENGELQKQVDELTEECKELRCEKIRLETSVEYWSDSYGEKKLENAERQKQVDELKKKLDKEYERGYYFGKQDALTSDRSDNATSESDTSVYEQAVKDTAKEILAKAPTDTDADERFIHWLRGHYGVKVE